MILLYLLTEEDCVALRIPRTVASEAQVAGVGSRKAGEKDLEVD